MQHPLLRWSAWTFYLIELDHPGSQAKHNWLYKTSSKYSLENHWELMQHLPNWYYILQQLSLAKREAKFWTNCSFWVIFKERSPLDMIAARISHYKKTATKTTSQTWTKAPYDLSIAILNHGEDQVTDLLLQRIFILSGVIAGEDRKQNEQIPVPSYKGSTSGCPSILISYCL